MNLLFIVIAVAWMLLVASAGALAGEGVQRPDHLAVPLPFLFHPLPGLGDHVAIPAEMTGFDAYDMVVSNGFLPKCFL